jgi:hypothetical protein
MFGPSLKSVPGCLVSIVPMLIGVPVALTPGFGPQAEVALVLALELLLEEVVPPLELAVEAVPPPVDAGLLLGLLLLGLLLLGLLLLGLLLLPHPANASSAIAETSAVISRTRRTCRYVVTDRLLSSRCEPPPYVRGSGAYTSSALFCMQGSRNPIPNFAATGLKAAILHASC